MTKKIVMLLGKRDSSTLLYNGIRKDFILDKIIIEDKKKKKKIILNRIKRLGILKVSGQLAFQLLCIPVLRWFSSKRIQEIKTIYKLDDTPIEKDKVLFVHSINSTQSLQALNKINPDLIIVNGTRIISKHILENINAPFINIHAGITPKYRGSHGGYWAIANNDKKSCGVTIHLIDAGIDTGNILYQATIKPTNEDNFITYPYLQLGEGIKLMKQAIKDFLSNVVNKQNSIKTKSRLWYHPTLWFYIINRVFKGIK